MSTLKIPSGRLRQSESCYWEYRPNPIINLSKQRLSGHTDHKWEYLNWNSNPNFCLDRLRIRNIVWCLPQCTCWKIFHTVSRAVFHRDRSDLPLLPETKEHSCTLYLWQWMPCGFWLADVERRGRLRYQSELTLGVGTWVICCCNCLPGMESCSSSVNQRVSPSSQQTPVISLHLVLVVGKVL